MFLRNFRHLIFTACLLGTLAFGGIGTTHATTDAIARTTQQGVHSWKTNSGMLFMVAGTYQDTTAYRRSVSFYFQANGKNDWQQVPIVESEVDLTTAWTTASRGETTLRDAIVASRGQNVYLVIADHFAEKPTFSVKRYKLSAAGPDYPDAPGMLFIPLSTAVYQVGKLKSVEAVLDKEITVLPKN